MAPIIENNYVGDGSSVLYSLTFEYIEASDVQVSLDSVTTSDWTFANPTQIQFNTAPGAGVAIRIYRNTTVDSPKATFYPGSAIRSQDLNDNFEQILFVTQEADVVSERAGQAADAATAAAAAATTAASDATTAATAAETAATDAQNLVSSATNAATTAAADAATAQAAATQAQADAAQAQTDAASAVAATLGFQAEYQTPGDDQTPIVAVAAAHPLKAELGVKLPTEATSTYEVEGAIRYNDGLDKIEMYDGSAWQTAAGGAKISSAPPSPASVGDVWYDHDNGRAYVYYADGDSNQWVEMNPSWNGSLADNSVSTVKIQDGAVTVAKLDPAISFTPPDGSITPAKLSTGGPTWDTSGKLGVGTPSPRQALDVSGQAVFNNGSDFYINASSGESILNYQNGVLRFDTASGEVARFDSAGRLLVGTTSSSVTATAVLQGNSAPGVGASHLYLQCDQIDPGVNSDTGFVRFADGAGSVFSHIVGQVDGTSSAGSKPGRIIFSTTPDGSTSPVERMRIGQDGAVMFGTNTPSETDDGAHFRSFANGTILTVVRDNALCAIINRRTGDGPVVSFRRGTTTSVGEISVTTTSTTYGTSSDYRLKENVVPVADAVARLQKLKPCRFNFKADPSKTVDGFLAHEAQEVIPECVTGEKDAVDDNGDPIYQGIDQSKLVPLLTAALQEAITRIETLEAQNAALDARITALEGGTP